MDSIVGKIIEKFVLRSQMGKKKYGTDLDRKDLTIEEWILHLQEELHDAILYSEKLLQEKTNSKPKERFGDWVKNKKYYKGEEHDCMNLNANQLNELFDMYIEEET